MMLTRQRLAPAPPVAVRVRRSGRDPHRVDRRGGHQPAAVTGVAALATASLLAVTLAGCGTSSGGAGIASANGGSARSAASATPAVAVDEEQRRLQLTACLRDHGVDIPDLGANGQPGFGAGALADVDRDKLQEALEACRQYAGGVGGQATRSPEQQQYLADYIHCLRDHGVDIADPDPSTGRPRQEDLQKFLNPDAAMEQAQQACEDEQPQGLASRGSR